MEKYIAAFVSGAAAIAINASALAQTVVHGGTAHDQTHSSKIGSASPSKQVTQGSDQPETAEREDSDEDSARASAPYNDPENPPTYRNGIGPDPDGDSNPATLTRGISKIGDAAEAAFDPPYQVVTFEAPPGSHDDSINKQYTNKYGVKFSKGLRRQICEGQRYFKYNSQCTYLRAPSGKYAALYADEFKRPLNIEFANPVCIAAMAIYPTGGKEGEQYEVTLQGYDSAGEKLDPATLKFTWTKDTFRWRHMAGAYYLEQPAHRLEVSMKSIDQSDKAVRFLIDDLAFVENSCDTAIDAIKNTAPSQPADESAENGAGDGPEYADEDGAGDNP